MDEGSTPRTPPQTLDPRDLFTPDQGPRTVNDRFSHLASGNSTSPNSPAYHAYHASPASPALPEDDLAKIPGFFDDLSLPELTQGTEYLMASNIYDEMDTSMLELDPSNSAADREVDASDEDMDLGSHMGNCGGQQSEDDSEEYDELESSQPCTPHHPAPASAPALAPLRVPAPAAISLVDYSSESECSPAPISRRNSLLISQIQSQIQSDEQSGDEIQVGGGRLREATPPTNLTPSRLRAKVVPTKNADEVAQEAARRRKENDGPPIPYASFVAEHRESLSEKVRKRNSVSLSVSKPQNDRGGDSKRQRTAKTKPKKPTAAPPQPVKNVFQSGPPRSPPAGVSKPPPVLPMGPPPAPSMPNIFQTGLAGSLSSPVESPLPAVPVPPDMFRGDLPDFFEQGGFHTVALPPPPPPVPSRRPPAVPVPPDMFRGDLPDFLEQGGFHTVALPPPPSSLNVHASSDPLGADGPASLTAAIIDRNGDIDFVPQDPPASDAFNGQDFEAGGSSNASSNASPAAQDVDEDDSEAPHSGDVDAGGRLKKVVAQQLSHCFDEMKQIAKAAALATGLTEQRVLRGFQRRLEGVDGRLAKTNWWNRYQTFANRPANRLQEWQRINPNFTCENEAEPPPLTAQDLIMGWEIWKKVYSPQTAQEILDADDDLHNLGSKQTVGGRHRHFEKMVDKLQHKLEKECSNNGYHSALIIVGSHVNEDASLGRMVTTGGLAGGAFLDKMRMTQDDLIGIAKTVAYADEIERSLFAEDKEDSTEPAAKSPVQSKQRRKVKAEPSEAKLTAAENAKARNRKVTVETNEWRDGFSASSKEDVGTDIFRDVRPKNAFAWWNTREVCSENNYRIIGYPSNVRLPFQTSSTKASGVLRAHERASMMKAITARKVPGQGIRIEKHEYNTGDYVIITHDYSKPTPPGAPTDPAVVKHWRSSNGTVLPVMDGNGEMWLAHYDLDGSIVSTERTAIPAAKGINSKTNTKGKGKAMSEDESSAGEDTGYEDEDETAAMLPPPKKAPSAAPTTRATSRTRVTSTVPPKPAAPLVKKASKASKAAPPPPPTGPPPATRATRSRLQEGGGGPSKPSNSAPLKSSLRRPSLEDSDDDSTTHLRQRLRKRVHMAVESDTDGDDVPLARTATPPRHNESLRHDASPPSKRAKTSDPLPRKEGKPSASSNRARRMAPEGQGSSQARPPPPAASSTGAPAPLPPAPRAGQGSSEARPPPAASSSGAPVPLPPAPHAGQVSSQVGPPHAASSSGFAAPLPPAPSAATLNLGTAAIARLASLGLSSDEFVTLLRDALPAAVAQTAAAPAP
ncbi:hypothetical protein FB451DRAFT_1513704 [Mycena latifolia]|nr:hypothetical protein FB451DRAFT_1513704 [Mycena latifolia]